MQGVRPVTKAKKMTMASMTVSFATGRNPFLMAYTGYYVKCTGLRVTCQ